MLPAIGLGIRRENRAILDDPAITGAEITLEHADDPLRVGRFVGERTFEYVSVHSLEMSPASAERPPQRYLDLVRAVVEENGAVAVSDHLGFTHDPQSGSAMGHFAPPPFTAEALDAVCRNVDRITAGFRGIPFYLETIAYFFRFRGDMEEAEFLRRVLERTGCGWLLDVTNVHANARNHGFDAWEFIESVLPSARRIQMHLAGGFFDRESRMYFDSHSAPVPTAVWNLYRRALQAAGGKVEAVFIERDDNFPNDDGWRREVRKARRIAEEALRPAEVRP